MNYILLLLSIVLVNNVITSQFLGICPFLGVSKKVDTAAGMGAAVTFVLALASLITYFIQMILVKTGTEYLQTIAFILVIQGRSYPCKRSFLLKGFYQSGCIIIRT